MLDKDEYHKEIAMGVAGFTNDIFNKMFSNTGTPVNNVNTFSQSTQDLQNQQNAQADWSTASQGLGQLVTNYNKAYTEAKTANEQRYNQMLNNLNGGATYSQNAYTALANNASTAYQNMLNYANQTSQQNQGNVASGYNQMMDVANQTTGQQAADVRSDYAKQGAQAQQNLARTGMANTTVAPTLAQGNQREQSAALNRLADTMQQTKLGIIQGKTNALSNLSSDQQKTILSLMGGQASTGEELAKAKIGDWNDYLKNKNAVIGSKTDAYPDLKSLQTMLAGITGAAPKGSSNALTNLVSALQGVKY